MAKLPALVRTRLALIAPLFAAVALYACGPAAKQPACRPQTCKGCCNADDRCEEGTKKPACGVGGVACNVCAETDYCRNGNCTSDPGCRSFGASCTAASECCTPYGCFSGTCNGGGSCTNPGGTCTFASDCCSNNCVTNVCQQSAGCNPQGGLCTPCCQLGLVCLGGYCQPGGGGGGGGGSSCVPFNGACTFSSQCCNSAPTCQNNKCQ